MFFIHLTYLCQTLNINQHQHEQIRSAYTSFLRRIVRGRFGRKVDENDDGTYQRVLSELRTFWTMSNGWKKIIWGTLLGRKTIAL